MTGLERLRRRPATLAAAGLAAGGLALFLGGARAGAPIPAALLGLCLGLAAWLAIDEHRRARLAARRGPGVVVVKEGRIGYMGPASGGLVDLDSVTAVEAERRDGALVWSIRREDGPPLAIPAGAEGAEALLDAFAALPGFDAAAAARLLDREEGSRAVLFRRAAGRLSGG